MSMEEDLGKIVAEHEIKYEDGDVEWLYLGQETFEILKKGGEESTPPVKKKQKRRSRVVDSDSEDEFIPSDDGEDEEEEEYVPDEPILSTPATSKKKNSPSSLSSFASTSSGHKRSRSSSKKVTPSTSSSRKRTKFTTPSSASTVASTTSTPGSGVLAMGQHAHDVDSKYSFLRPKNIKDKNGRKPDHPDYDATTLFIPPAFLKKQTPAKQQWWEIKSDNKDAVLFFKVGKFYEIFHMDADVAVRIFLDTHTHNSFKHTHTHNSFKHTHTHISGTRDICDIHER
jgi:DNA mismatch repair protein MSH6